jgi:hypothetical protein
MNDRPSQVTFPFSDEQPKEAIMPIVPSLIWPEPRWHSGQASYKNKPPFFSLLENADLISGILVGASANTINWLDTCLKKDWECKIKLIIIVYQAGPTREAHLLELKKLQNQTSGKKGSLEIRLLPMTRSYEQDFERMILPPSTLQVHDSKVGKNWLCIGSVNDYGCDNIYMGSINLIFQPADALRDHWRRWFQYIFSSSAPLSDETCKIPHLVPAEGDFAAAEMWADFKAVCLLSQFDHNHKPKVDQDTGEVVANPDGSEIEPWDNGATALDPLAQKFQQMYAESWLVTIDETTRLKPLAIPVKAALLGQQSERTVGAITQRQSFKLEILDEAVAKEIEKYRSINHVMNLLSYLLSIGNRLLPEPAKCLLEKELEIRNKKGCVSLKNALGVNGVSEYI